VARNGKRSRKKETMSKQFALLKDIGQEVEIVETITYYRVKRGSWTDFVSEDEVAEIIIMPEQKTFYRIWRLSEHNPNLYIFDQEVESWGHACFQASSLSIEYRHVFIEEIKRYPGFASVMSSAHGLTHEVLKTKRDIAAEYRDGQIT
jgi:hypothetical protein